MGLNINSLLMLEGASEQFAIPSYINCTTDSFYIRSYEQVLEFNNELRKAHMDFYAIDYTLNEGVVVDIFSKIVGIFGAIIEFIGNILSAILSAIKSFIDSFRKKKVETDDNYEDDVIKLYNQSKYIKMNTYSNTLSDAFLSKVDPPVSLEFTSQKSFDDMQDMIYKSYKGSKINAAKSIETIENLLDKYKDTRLNIRQKMTGVKTVSNPDDPTWFKTELVNHYIGLKADRTIDLNAALNAKKNIKQYDELAKYWDGVKKTITKEYHGLQDQIKKFRDNMSDMIAHPEKHASEEEYQRYVTKAATFAISLSSVINGVCTDHLLAISTKLDCIGTMRQQDYVIYNEVRRAIKTPVDEFYISRDPDVEELNEAYSDLYTACLFYQEAASQLKYRRMINSVLNEVDTPATDGKPANQTAADNGNAPAQAQQQSSGDNNSSQQQSSSTSTKSSSSERGAVDLFKSAVNAVRKMFQKFQNKVNTLQDRAWLRQNKEKLTNLQIPATKEEIGDWTTFDIENLQKSLSVPTFDPNNAQLMKNLESEESFAKEIYKAIGTKNESKIKPDASFIDHCKGLYGVKENDGVISRQKLQEFVPTMVDYCTKYSEHGQNSIPKSIEGDMKQLDRSRMAIESVLSQVRQNISSSETKTVVQQPQSTATQATEKQESTNIVDFVKSNSGKSVSAAEILGLIHEVDTPEPKKDYEDTAKENITKAAGDNLDKLNDIDDKAMLYFKMVGNAIGARMTVSLKAHQEYMKVLKWAVAGTNKPEAGKDKTATKEEVKTDSIIPEENTQEKK